MSPATALLIRELQWSPPTSGSLDQTALGSSARLDGPHLDNWIGLFGSKSIFDFAESKMTQGYDPDGSRPATGRQVRCWEGSSYKGHGVDALAPRADEGRGRLRKASGSREQTLIRRCPNGETRLG